VIVEPDLYVYSEGDRLVVEMAGEVARLDPDRALVVAFAAIDVAVRGQRGAATRLAYWIDQATGDALDEQLNRGRP
jgi:hypothetical protein